MSYIRLLILSISALCSLSAFASSYSISTGFVPQSFLGAGAQGAIGNIELTLAGMPTSTLTLLDDTGPTPPDFTKGKFENGKGAFGMNFSIGILSRLDAVIGGLGKRPDWGGKFQFLGEPGIPKSGQFAAAVAYFQRKDHDSDSKAKAPLSGNAEGRNWDLESKTQTVHFLASYGLSDWWQLTADVYRSDVKASGYLHKYDQAIPYDTTWSFAGSGELIGVGVGATYQLSSACSLSVELDGIHSKFTNAETKTVSAAGVAGSCRIRW